MMIRIAESPDSDKSNEGKTITPYHAAELAGMYLGDFLATCEYLARGPVSDRWFTMNGYTFEVMKGKEK